jgi:hypothetical protein
MDKIILPANEPIELEIPKFSTTIGSGENVQMTVPVLVPETPPRERQIVLVISLEHAQHIAGQLQASIVTAKANARRR